MADETAEVLELEDDQMLEDDPPVDTGPDDEEPDSGDDAPEESDGGDFIGFEGEEAAPASDSESSTIRELRQRNRELTTEIKALRNGKAEEVVEVGERPTLESCDFDEDRYTAEYDAWRDRKAQAERVEAEAKERQGKQAEEWADLHRSYEADKASLNVPDFDEAEAEVAAVLPESTRALLLKSGKGAALVAALHRSPSKLEELSKLDPTDAALMIGELRSKLTMTKRSRPNPDRPVRGTAAPVNADKELARLEKEAERTGDRTRLINYKRSLKRA